jgi:hypothetical protein
MYGAIPQPSGKFTKSNIDPSELRVDFHQHIERKPLVARFTFDVELGDTLRCDAGAIAVSFHRRVLLRGLGGGYDDKEIKFALAHVARNVFLVQPSENLIALPVRVGIDLCRFAHDETHSLVVGSLAEIFDKGVNVAVHLTLIREDKDTPIFDLDALMLARWWKNTFLKTALRDIHSPLLTPGLPLPPNASCGSARRRAGTSVILSFTLIPYAKSIGSVLWSSNCFLAMISC